MKARPLDRQRGTAAVELAFVLGCFMLFFAALLFLARLFWHYTAAQKAAQDAALYASRLTPEEISNSTLGLHAASLAREIAHTELSELNTGGAAPAVGVYCKSSCGLLGVPLTPEMIVVDVVMTMKDPYFEWEYAAWGVLIHTSAELRYVGN